MHFHGEETQNRAILSQLLKRCEKEVLVGKQKGPFPITTTTTTTTTALFESKQKKMKSKFSNE
ncbi:hypothetical protein HMI54_014860 [Coelomomyces lativittatus]|nr:hypothetical protein HMI54_014860 [Coelomomyces lativittatus]